MEKLVNAIVILIAITITGFVGFSAYHNVEMQATNPCKDSRIAQRLHCQSESIYTVLWIEFGSELENACGCRINEEDVLFTPERTQTISTLGMTRWRERETHNALSASR